MSADPPGRPSELLELKVRVPQHVVYRAFPLETVVLNLETGKYHGLDPVGGRMLEVLDDLGHVGATAASVAEEFGHPADEVERDLCELCDDLLRRGLVEIDAADTES